MVHAPFVSHGDSQFFQHPIKYKIYALGKERYRFIFIQLLPGVIKIRLLFGVQKVWHATKVWMPDNGAGNTFQVSKSNWGEMGAD
jgi:hypothetical protein